MATRTGTVAGSGNGNPYIDSLICGGNDTLNGGAGVDLIQSSVSYKLSANFENMTRTGSSALNATGNALVNVITGNVGDNILDGGAGRRQDHL